MFLWIQISALKNTIEMKTCFHFTLYNLQNSKVTPGNITYSINFSHSVPLFLINYSIINLLFYHLFSVILKQVWISQQKNIFNNYKFRRKERIKDINEETLSILNRRKRILRNCVLFFFH